MDVLQAAIVGDFFTSAFAGPRFVQVAVIIAAAFLIIFLFDRLVELLTPKVVKRADTITTTANVMRIRRAETLIGLGITLVRAAVVVAALFVLWHVSSPGAQPLALIGIGTVVVVLGSATVVPLLRDVTYGFIMIFEKWYGVGDHIVIEPFTGTGGVVERMSLRSTKIRSFNGEAIWMHHQHIQGVRVTSAASHSLLVETFVNDPKRGQKLIEDACKIIPSGPTTLPQPLTVSEVTKVDDKIWRVTAICEVAPFREWVIEQFGLDVIKKTDELTNAKPVIVHGPVAYYADQTAERRYRRSATMRKRIRSSSHR